ncbi:hypothetical protein B9Z55_005117 [Caenorhabditis nigoni]|nr:hypothetical protein B9Z55_028908 [Caenorhabditis nigoni]PIC44914.1 hypothetical protein B9Z55_005117 [Caenorhabditis nigoni]
MSKFLEIPNCAMTPWCLQQEALHYILRECRQSIDTIDYSGGHPEGNTKGQEKKLIQLLIDKSNGNLRMYGTAEELLENLNIFKNFPANLTFFDNSMECYQTRPRIFKSFNNEEYIAKSDLFVILQNMIIELGPVKIIHVALFLAFYLKTHEKKVENSMEFVKFDKNFFDEIEKEFKEKVSTDDALAARVLHGFVEFANLSQAQIVEKFQELIPSALSRRTHFFINRLTNFFNSAAEGLRFGMPGVWAILSLQIKALKSVIDRNPNMFCHVTKIQKSQLL